MILFFVFSLAVAIGYIYLLTWISDGWDEMPDWTPPGNYVPETRVSVIVPARNEAQNISACLDSLLQANYPGHLLEIIVVDDHSTDETADIVRKYGHNVKLISLAESEGKKQALHHGVKKTTGELIYCTDADCRITPNLLRTFVSYFEYRGWDFATGPVISDYYRSILTSFQFLDFAGMMQVNGNGIHRKMYYIANGANMAFRKASWKTLDGWKSSQDIASGDDMFLIQAMADHPDMKVAYIKSPQAVVTTRPESNLAALLRQRKRWASKTRHYSGRNITRIQAYVFFIHALVIFNLLIIPWTVGLSLFTAIFVLFIKMTMDFLFLAKAARYLGNIKALKYFIPSGFLYFLVIFYSAGAALFTKTYDWKGRKVL